MRVGVAETGNSFFRETRRLLSAPSPVSVVPSAELSLLMFYSKSLNGFAAQTEFLQATWHLGRRTEVNVGDWRAEEQLEGASAQSWTTYLKF